MSTKEVVMTEEWNESDDFKRVGTEGLSGEDIAPTLIELMGMQQPADMTGKSLLVK